MLLDQYGRIVAQAMIKDQILEILDEESIPDERANFLAMAMIRDLRCDRCRHFKVEGSFTECLHPENRWPDRDFDGEEHLSPKPDFFCALFEPKA